MIDTTKTVGTADTFDQGRINDLLSRGVINNISNLEKAIFSLEYLGQLEREGLDLVFKGGSAVQVFLGDKWNRLSIDIDICTNSTEKEVTSILEKIHRKFDEKTFAFSPRDRDVGDDVPFYLYRIETPTINNGRRNILLDVMGVKPAFPIIQIPLKTSFFDSSAKVKIPTGGALLGDKLSTIGPTTIGRHLVDSRNGLEYAKHFYDINSLQETDFSMAECAKAYREAIQIQSKIRNKVFSEDECFKDTLFTCQVASLSQQIGQKILERLDGIARARALTEFRILRNGLERFRPFLVQNLSYSWDDLRNYASRTTLIIKMINNKIPDEHAKAILKTGFPTKKEQISRLIGKLRSIPEKERWFIDLDELANFPRILKNWHDVFFLELL